MKLQIFAVMGLALAITSPALADKRLDDALAKAMDQADKGRDEDALKTMQKAVSQAPSVEAYAMFARLQRRLGKVTDAAASAAKAVEMASAPNDKAQALAVQSAYDLEVGTGRDALAHAQQAVAASPTAEAQAALARAQVRMQDTAAALASADRAVQAGAGSAAAHAARGEALTAAGKGADAVAEWRKALELDAKYPGAHAGLAMALLAQGKAAEAVTEAKTATETEAHDPAGFAALGLAKLAADPKAWADAIGEAQQGAFLANQQQETAPGVQYAVGRIFDAQDRVPEATAAYQAALAGDPSFTPARVALVKGQVRQGNLDAALPEIKKLAAEAPGSGDAQLLLGSVLARKEDFAGAEAPLGRAVELLPGNSEAWFLRGFTLLRLNKMADAAAAYKHAVELAPTNNDYRLTYGLLLGMSGQHEAGVAELKKVVSAPGYNDPAGWMNLGWLYRNMQPKRLDDSINAYKKALELSPKNAEAARGLGMAYASKHDWDQAIGAFNNAQTLDPKLAGDANARIAWAYLGKKDVAQAQAYADKAKASGKTDTKLFENIDKLRKNIQQQIEQEAEPDEPPPVARVASTPHNAAAYGEVCLRGGGGTLSRSEACSGLSDFGGAGVNTLINVVRSEPDVGIRVAAVNALAAIGAPAKSALPHLKQQYDALTPPGMPTPAQEKEMERVKPLRRALALAIDKLR